MGKKNKSGKKTNQQEGESPGGNKTATVNGISAEKQNFVAEESPNTGKSFEQTIKPRINDNDKQKDNKKEKAKLKGLTAKKKQKKAGSISNLFSIKRLFLFYILVVFFWCNGRTQNQCNLYEEALCFNGISQYILKHDYFKYIEPAIDSIKQNVDVYGKKTLDTVSVHYETHVKPYADPFLESAQPHLQNARELSAEYVYTPVMKGLIKAKEFYNDNAREHVDNYYDQAVKFSAPYVSQAQEQAVYTYEQALEYNKNTIKPWYHKKVVPHVVDYKDKAILYYDTRIVPTAYRILEAIREIYYKKIVPAYHNHVEPHILTLLKFIQRTETGKTKAETEREADKKIKAEAEKRAKEEADKKAKAEAERKAKEEADKKAKAEAERKAKEETDKKAKVEAERKAKEEADKKAKVEAERKAKEEADKKAKVEAERKAKEEADKKAIAATSKSVHDAFHKELPLVKKNLTLALDNYEKKATSITQNILHEVEARILTLRNSGSEYLVELKKFMEKIKDSTKDRKTKLNEIMDLAKELIENIKEKSQDSVEVSKKSFNDLEEKTFDELKKEIDLNLDSQISKINNLVGDKKIDDKLRTDIETTIKSITREFNENKNSASLRTRENFAIINNKIDLLTSTKDDIVKDIHSYVKTEKEILKSEKDSDAPSIEVQNAHKNDNQVPVQVKEKPSAEENTSDNHLIDDPVLDKLKARRDSVLDKLRKGYESFKVEKGNEPSVQVQSVDEEEEYYGDDDDDDNDDDGESGECSED